MKKWYYYCLYCILLIVSISSSLAQVNEENKKPFEISCDVMSRYVWRGTDFGASPSIQPGVSYSFNNFKIGAWGAYTTNSPGVQEVDLFVSYTIKEIITVSITDYYFPDELSDYKYFDYGDTSTRHIFEGSIAFNGTEKLPLSAFIATNLYGADARKINPDGSTGGIQYSTYAELTYSFRYFDTFIGFNLTSPDVDKGESGYYGNKFGVVNLGISVVKEVPITSKFNLPLEVLLITNPQAEKIYLVAGISF